MLQLGYQCLEEIVQDLGSRCCVGCLLGCLGSKCLVTEWLEHNVSPVETGDVAWETEKSGAGLILHDSKILNPH